MSFLCAVTIDESLPETIEAMDKAMNNWTDKAARGECAWICSDCCCNFPEGMPDECAHGHQKCTDIIQRDKAMAQGQVMQTKFIFIIKSLHVDTYRALMQAFPDAQFAGTIKGGDKYS